MEAYQKNILNFKIKCFEAINMKYATNDLKLCRSSPNHLRLRNMSLTTLKLCRSSLNHPSLRNMPLTTFKLCILSPNYPK